MTEKDCKQEIEKHFGWYEKAGVRFMRFLDYEWEEFWKEKGNRTIEAGTGGSYRKKIAECEICGSKEHTTNDHLAGESENMASHGE